MLDTLFTPEIRKKIAANLDPRSIIDIVFSGPDRWKMVASKLLSGGRYNPHDERALYHSARDAELAFKVAKLLHITKTERTISRDKVLAVSCEFSPQMGPLQLCFDQIEYGSMGIQSKKLATRKALYLPMPTTSLGVFNNGFGLNQPGKKQNTIPPFKGGVGLHLDPDLTANGPISIYTPDEAHGNILSDEVIFGTSLQFTAASGTSQEGATELMRKQGYWGSYNEQQGFLFVAGRHSGYCTTLNPDVGKLTQKELLALYPDANADGEHFGYEAFFARLNEAVRGVSSHLVQQYPAIAPEAIRICAVEEGWLAEPRVRNLTLLPPQEPGLYLPLKS